MNLKKDRECVSTQIEPWEYYWIILVCRPTEDDYKKEEEVAGRVPEESFKPVQSRHGESSRATISLVNASYS